MSEEPEATPAARIWSRQALRGDGAVAVAAAALATAVLALVVPIGRFSLGIPFDYSGNAIQLAAFLKAVGEEGPFHASRIGAPLGTAFADWPVASAFTLFGLGPLARAGGSPGLVLNVVWLVGLVLSAATAAWALRRLEFGAMPAIGLGLAYALLPCAFYRGVTELALSRPLFPLVALLGFRLCGAGRPPARGERLVLLGAVLSLGLASADDGLLAAVPLLFAAGVSLLAARDRLRLGALALLLLGIGCSASLAPRLLRVRELGPNDRLESRLAVMGDPQGVRLRELLLPIDEHPLAPLRALTERVGRARFPGESRRQRLGTLAGVGLLLLLGFAVARAAGALQGDAAVGPAALLAFATLLVSSSGGLATLFGGRLLQDPDALGRSVALLGFLGLFAVATLAARTPEALATARSRLHAWPRPQWLAAAWRLPQWLAAASRRLLHSVIPSGGPACRSVARRTGGRGSALRSFPGTGPAQSLTSGDPARLDLHSVIRRPANETAAEESTVASGTADPSGAAGNHPRDDGRSLGARTGDDRRHGTTDLRRRIGERVRALRGRRVSVVVRALAFVAFCAAVVADQVPRTFLGDTRSSGTTAFQHDARFVAALEGALPTGAQVFQLPVAPLPLVTLPGATVLGQEQARAYLHSQHARWSWGSVFGRDRGVPQDLGALAPGPLVRRLSALGFGGIWLAREEGALFGSLPISDFEDALAAAGAPLLRSEDGRFGFASLPRAARGPAATETAVARQKAGAARAADESLPPQPEWDSGCSDEHGPVTTPTRVCGHSARATFAGPSHEARPVVLRASFRAARPGTLTVSGKAFRDEVRLHDVAVPYQRELTLPADASLVVELAFAGPCDATSPRARCVELLQFDAVPRAPLRGRPR